MDAHDSINILENVCELCEFIILDEKDLSDWYLCDNKICVIYGFNCLYIKNKYLISSVGIKGVERNKDLIESLIFLQNGIYKIKFKKFSEQYYLKHKFLL